MLFESAPGVYILAMVNVIVIHISRGFAICFMFEDGQVIKFDYEYGLDNDALPDMWYAMLQGRRAEPISTTSDRGFSVACIEREHLLLRHEPLSGPPLSMFRRLDTMAPLAGHVRSLLQSEIA